MNAQRTIDTHTHILTDETMALLRKEAPKVGPTLADEKGDNGLLTVAGVGYRPFPRGGWNVEKRLQDMDATGVDVHVLSATPQSYYYDQEPSAGIALSAIQNEGMAKLVKQQPDRFMGIATLPMQAPEAAAKELRRAVRELGFCGAMIGSNCRGKNLDDPSFEPFWAAADELSAFIFIHPNDVAGMDRMKSYYLRNFIGNPLDTTIAAASLVFGGILERFSKMTVVLAHGGGMVPYQMGRWVHGWKERAEAKVHLKGSPQPSIDKLRFDTILHAKPQLESMIGWVGPERVLLGSDYPYDMAMMDCVAHVRSLNIPDRDKDVILGAEAEKLLAKPHGSARARASAAQ